METQSGTIEIGGEILPATLSLVDGRVTLQITYGAGRSPFAGMPNLPRAVFRGSRSAMTLVGGTFASSQTRLGVGGTAVYRFQFAIEDLLFDADELIESDEWGIYVEDVARIHHVSGLQQSFAGELTSISWSFTRPESVRMECPTAGLALRLGQDFRTSGDAIDGPAVSFRYPAIIELPGPLEIFEALTTLGRIRFFFSMLMGRVLASEEVDIRVGEAGSKRSFPVHGLIQTERSPDPARPIVRVGDVASTAHQLDRWLSRYDDLGEAAHLHLEGLEQRRLPMQLRFQLFAQALEALHRRTGAAVGEPIDVPDVREKLEQAGVRNDVIERVAGILAHAHEPGLRQRLREYWGLFSTEITVLRPGLSRNSFVGRAVATRNHFAHRTDLDSQVYQGVDLWNATETLKAIAHMALLREIDVDVTGIGQAMLNARFVNFAEPL